MAKTTIKAQMKQRRDTKANWASSNPVLLSGELGFVSDDPNLYKMGDGVTPWNLLPFRGFDGTLAQELGTSPNAVISQKVLSAKFAEIEEKIEDLEEGGSSGSGSTGGSDLSNGGTINGSLEVTGTLTVDRNLYLKGDNAYHLIKADADGNLVINSDKVLEVSTNGGMTIDGNEAIHAGNISEYVSSGSGSGGTVDTSGLVNLTGPQTITGPKTFEAIRIHGNAQLLTDLQVADTSSIGSDESPLGSISTKRAAVNEVLAMGLGSYVLGNLVPNTLEANTLGSTEAYWKTLYSKNVIIGKEGEETASAFNGAAIFNNIAYLYGGAYVRGKLQVLGQDVITQKEVVQESNTVTIAEEGGIYIINTLNAGDVTISAFEAPYTDIGRYTVIFRGASSLTLPSNVLWANGTVPTIEADKYYELSVMATKIAGTTYYKAILAGFKEA